MVDYTNPALLQFYVEFIRAKEGPLHRKLLFILSAKGHGTGIVRNVISDQELLSIVELARHLNLSPDAISLSEHEIVIHESHSKYLKLSRVYYFIFSVPCLFFIVPSFIFSVRSFEFYYNGGYEFGDSYLRVVFCTFIVAALVGFNLLVVSISASTCFMLSQRLSRRRFLVPHSDSLLAIEVVRAVLDLKYEDVIANPTKKRCLLKRIDKLIEYSSGINPSFVRNPNKWSIDHFSRMSMFFNRRKYWVISPQSCTLNQLREDMYKVAKVIIDGRFGDFDWEKESPENEFALPKEKKRISEILHAPILMLPLAIMGLGLWQHQWLDSVHISSSLVALLFLTWLLIIIDAKLKLGVIDKIASVGKGIKELS